MMARMPAFLEAIGPYGATEEQLRAQAVEPALLREAERRGWIERYQYPEERCWCYRLTASGRTERDRSKAV